MVNTSWAWDNAFAPERTLVPETFVEISLGVVDTRSIWDVSYTYFGNHSSSIKYGLIGSSDLVIPTNYATFEENRWVLDGSKTPSETSIFAGTGFVGNLPNSAVGGANSHIQFRWPDKTTTVAPGITIVWDSENGGYPRSFILGFGDSTNPSESCSIFISNGKIDGVYGDCGGNVKITGIDWSVPNVVRLTGDFSGYNQVDIGITEWGIPNNRPRMDRFIFGQTWTFDKNDILSYSHEQSGDILGAELPKNSITFSVSNVDDKWNPNNPEGLGRYIVERQMLTVRYGVNTGINAGSGTIRWIPAGVFYLSEWDIPSNGLEATFTARDPFEFIMNTGYPGLDETTQMGLIETSLAMGDFPTEIEMNLSPSYNYTCVIPEESVDVNAGEFGLSTFSLADVIQLCVNASGSVCWFDRDGVFQVKGISKLKNIEKIYDIPLDLAYSHPEIVVNKPVKFVEIDYNPIYSLPDGHKLFFVDADNITEGETLKISNDFIQSSANRNDVAASTRMVVKHRKQVTGEFRANPCLDLFDWVNVHTKWGEMKMIVTRIKYTYSGAFRAEYTAREMDYVEVYE